VVVRAGVDTKDLYLDALAQLDDVRILGTVRTAARPSLADGYLPADRLHAQYAGRPRRSKVLAAQLRSLDKAQL
jgi:hypothetical protein